MIFLLIATGRVEAADVAPVALQFSPTFRPPNSEYWKSLRIPTIDHQGKVAFRTFVDAEHYDGGVNSAYRTGENQFIARVGDQAPSLAEGVPLSIADAPPAVDFKMSCRCGWGMGLRSWLYCPISRLPGRVWSQQYASRWTFPPVSHIVNIDTVYRRLAAH